MRRNHHAPQVDVVRQASRNRVRPIQHVIADCRLRRAEPLWVLCCCDLTIRADRMTELEAAFNQHRREAGCDEAFSIAYSRPVPV